MYHIDWFADIKESLHSWDKAHLVMMYDFFPKSTFMAYTFWFFSYPIPLSGHVWLLSCCFKFLSSWVSLHIGFSLRFHLICLGEEGWRYQLTFPLLCSPLTHFFPALHFSPLSTSHSLSPFHFSWNHGPWISCPHQNRWLPSLCSRGGGTPWKPQMPSFIFLISYFQHISYF